MTLDPEAGEFLRAAGDLNGLPLQSLPLDQARRLEVEMLRFAAAPEEIADIADMRIPTHEGDVPVRIYDPDPAAELPVVEFLHGGGWTLGGLDVADVQSRALAAAAHVRVVTVDYRLAPEHMYPAALKDAFAVFAVLSKDGPVAVAGDSAGGNLAAAIALMARDRGVRAPVHQLLIYPMLDPSGDYPSRWSNATGYGLTPELAEWFWQNYTPEERRHDPYFAPMWRLDLSGLAPATILAAQYDPLRDEAVLYAQRLQDAGVATRLVCYPGQIHGFWSYGGIISSASQLTRDAADSLSRAFRVPATRSRPATTLSNSLRSSLS